MCCSCNAVFSQDDSIADEAHTSVAQLSRRSVLAGLGGLAAIGGFAACASSSTTTVTTAAPASKPSTEDVKLGAVLLGTQAGPPPSPTRTGISTAVTVEGKTYIVDCGRGATTQYVRSGLRFRSLQAIFLTHLHADHLADYFNFFLLAGNVPNRAHDDNLGETIRVYGPGGAGGLPPAFGGATVPTVAPQSSTPGTREMTDRLVEAYAYSENIFLRDSGIRDITALMEVHDIELPDVGAGYLNTAPRMSPFTVVEDDRVKVTAVLVPHGPVFPAFAFRFDTDHGSITLSGDTRESDNLVNLAQGTDVLIHEAINVRGVDMPGALRDHLLESHVEVQKVGAVAERAGAKQLVLSHIAGSAVDPLDPVQWKKWAQIGYGGPVTIGHDLQEIVVA